MNIFICGGVSPTMKKNLLNGIDELAKALAKNKHNIMCVGAKTGAIGKMYAAYKKNNGYVLIMVPDCYQSDAVGIENQMVAFPDLYSMQQFALKNSGATIFLPGGNGTIAELFMTIDNVKSGFHNDPIILYNPSGFYTSFSELEKELVNAGVAEHSQNEKVFICKTPEEVIEILNQYSTKK